MKVRDIAWAAGFLEGEGCFSHTRSTPMVTVSQVQRWPLDRMAEVFGGVPRLIRAREKVGEHWRWQLYGQRSIEVMMTVLPLLSPRRREQVKAAIEIWKHRFASGAACGKGGRQRAKTHCIRGHPLSGDNLRTRHGYRHCRACTKIRNRAAYERRKDRLALGA
jgi:hypothetical protein